MQHPALAKLETQENVKTRFVTAVQELFLYLQHREQASELRMFLNLTTQLFHLLLKNQYTTGKPHNTHFML